MKNISKNLVLSAVVGLVVGLIIGWFIGRGSLGENNSQKAGEVSDNLETTNGISLEMTDRTGSAPVIDALRANSSPSQESESAIFVLDQMAGNTATVASVETDHSSWVVIREDKNGVLGNILGASRVDAGASNSIVVSLLRPTVAGAVYQVVLYKDNGDSQFDYRADVPLTSNGVLISKSFSAQ